MWQVYPLGFAGVPVREPVDPAPRLGTAEDWQSLVAACDERGIAVILNGVFSHVADVMRYWLDQGATGWRLDAAYSVDSEFWREVLHQVHTTHPTPSFLTK